MDPIVVINPNSTEAVTRGIDRSVEPLRLAGGPPIECLTLKEGPPGIESQQAADAVIMPLCALIRSRQETATAFVIACFSDPGLHAAREVTRKPVFGIAECSIATALTRGERFGIISILENSVVRHQRLVRAMGLSERFAGDIALEIGIQGLGDEERVLDRMISIGRRLKDDHGSNVIIMGCAGMARYWDKLQTAVGIPVIEPTRAAVTMAISEVICGVSVAPHEGSERIVDPTQG
ncbi:MAG: aspartate/glutamate racemase family protein [Acidobacteria bacterium]|nr:aspartate/glutamate racemase family protein [Acidobacteriota bacterium]